METKKRKLLKAARNIQNRLLLQKRTVEAASRAKSEFIINIIHFPIEFCSFVYRARYLHNHCQEALYTHMLKIIGETLDGLRNNSIIH